jgi:hypothetical protein
MKTIILSSLITFISAWAVAGKFEIIGEGTSTKNAEFIKIQISVKSECSPTALIARNTTDDLSQLIVKTLANYKTNIPDQVQVSPGSNEQKKKVIYVNNQEVVICDENHSWTSQTTIDFKLDTMSKLAMLQDELLKLNPQTPANAINTLVTQLNLSQPTGGVLATTWDDMNDLALKRAQQNALRQVNVLISDLLPQKIQLAKVTAVTQASGQIIYDRVDSEGDTSGLGLGKVSVKVSRQFTYIVGP